MTPLRTASVLAVITALLASMAPATAEEMTAEDILKRLKAQRTRTLGFVDQSKPEAGAGEEETAVTMAPKTDDTEVAATAPTVGSEVSGLQPVDGTGDTTLAASGDSSVSRAGVAEVAATDGSDTRPSLATASAEALKIDLTIYFDFDSAVLKATSKTQLDALCRAVQLDTGAGTYQIIGHTDAKGKASYNKRLSLARAKEVVRYMTGTCGIDAARLQAIGKGEEELKLPGEPGADENRRVEVQVLS